MLISNGLRLIFFCLLFLAQPISFHTSRHTFASTVTLANNISLEVVSKMLGHTNTRMTAHYAKLIDKCIGEQMDKLMDTFTGNSDY
jgi:site-specific recombinase XerD